MAEAMCKTQTEVVKLEEMTSDELEVTVGLIQETAFVLPSFVPGERMKGEVWR